MNETTISAEALLRYPAVDEARLDALLARELAASRTKLVVLDDDPTGVQTVHGVSVYTDWSVESVRQGFAEATRLFFLLTNSRSFTAEQTVKAHREIAENVCRVSRETGTPFLLLSRSDSTLRGHYPLETETLRDTIRACGGGEIDGEVLCPFFKEGGRYTLNNVHYVRAGDTLVPAGETEFAGDKTFGYRASELREYVEEKTGGAVRADDVTGISLDELRAADVDGITAKLCAVRDYGRVVVNAVDYCDVKAFAVALYRAVAAGKRFLFRTAAGLVKVLGGVPDRPLLTRADMVKRETPHGGLVIAGSHTKKTTEQLNALLTLPDVEAVELRSDAVLDGDDALLAAAAEASKRCEAIIRAGKTAVCYTSRRLLSVENDTPEDALRRSVKISEGVCAVVTGLGVTPAFVVAKGGITSSDVGTKALGVRRALVLGQIRPGVPVWETGAESRFPNTPYVIFPGNVGEVETLKEAVEVLTKTP